MTSELIVVLHNIRSIHNVGSIFRSADAAGVNRLILSGYTPAPLDRFGMPRKDLAKVALGAEKNIPWEQSTRLSPLLKRLKKEGCRILAVEQSERSTSLFDWAPPKADTPIALILGNEVRGLSKQALNLVDEVLEIPMYGKKESLNVSVAGGIVMVVVKEKIKG